MRWWIIAADVPRKVFEPLIGCEDAARLLGNIHLKTLQRHARSGTLPGYRVAGVWYFRATELDVWLRYRENLPDGNTKRRSVAIGSIKEFPNESQARKAALSWLFSMSAEATNGTTVSFGAVIRRYLAEEIPKGPSTASRYRRWLKNHVDPKWRDYPIEQIKPLLVEDWLKKLNFGTEKQVSSQEPNARDV